MADVTQLQTIIEPAVSAVGLQLWGIEYWSQGKYSTLRVYIDGENGVTLDDCETASRQISALLDVEDPLAGEYNLEVSSPGLDRPLFNVAQYQRYIGETVAIRLHHAVDGKRKLRGIIKAVSDDSVSISMDIDGEELTLSLADIAKANLIGKV